MKWADSVKGGLRSFFRAIFFADFFKKMFDATDPTVSSSRWLQTFSGVCIILTACGLVFYCAQKNQAIPGGTEALLVGLFFAAVLNKAYTTYTEMKTEISQKQNNLINKVGS
jgi:hypothetical protein